MTHMSRYSVLGGCLKLTVSDALALFADLVAQGAPYALTWRVGIYIVNTLLDWVTGNSNRL